MLTKKAPPISKTPITCLYDFFCLLNIGTFICMLCLSEHLYSTQRPAKTPTLQNVIMHEYQSQGEFFKLTVQKVSEKTQ
jgi:hypothetical protein